MAGITGIYGGIRDGVLRDGNLFRLHGFNEGIPHPDSVCRACDKPSPGRCGFSEASPVAGHRGMTFADNRTLLGFVS